MASLFLKNWVSLAVAKIVANEISSSWKVSNKVYNNQLNFQLYFRNYASYADFFLNTVYSNISASLTPFIRRCYKHALYQSPARTILQFVSMGFNTALRSIFRSTILLDAILIARLQSVIPALNPLSVVSKVSRSKPFMNFKWPSV